MKKEKENPFLGLLSLDWYKGEVTPVQIRKALRKKGPVIRSFEKKFGDLIDIRVQGKDRFYSVDEKKVEELMSRITETATEKIEKKTKNSFPDEEAIMKTIVLLATTPTTTSHINEISTLLGWKKQRSLGKKYTFYQEVKGVLDSFNLNYRLMVTKKDVQIELENNREDVINNLSSLLGEENKIIINSISLKEPKEDTKADEVKAEVKVKEAAKEEKEAKKVYSPRETATYEPKTSYESARTRWIKGILTEILSSSKKNTEIDVIDIINLAKRICHRYPIR